MRAGGLCGLGCDDYNLKDTYGGAFQIGFAGLSLAWALVLSFWIMRVRGLPAPFSRVNGLI